jgi:plastocyanin
MKALVAAYVLAAALAAPALLWAADDPPADPAAATTPATTPAPASAPTAQPAQAAPDPATVQPVTTQAPGPADEQVTKTSDLAPAAQPKAHAAGASAVTIKNFAFSPATVTVTKGDTVTWTNQDSAPHTATAKDGSFDTGNLKKGASGSHKFTKTGSFAYICAIHPNMTAKIVVKAASSGNGSSGSGSGSSGSGSSSSGSSSSGSSDFQLSDTAGSGSSSSSNSLASTGGNVGTTLLIGLLLLSGGALLRYRSGPRETL